MLGCEICQLDNITLDSIKQKFLSGQDTDEIGMLLGIDFDTVRAHCLYCIKKPRSQQERYIELIEQLEEDVGSARTAMLENSTNAGLQQGYARIVTEYREAIAKHDELIKPEDTVKNIVIRVMNPLIRETLRGMTEEVNRLKIELQAAGLTPEVSGKLLEEFFKRNASRLKSNTNSSVVGLNSYFGAVDTMTTKTLIDKTIQ